MRHLLPLSLILLGLAVASTESGNGYFGPEAHVFFDRFVKECASDPSTAFPPTGLVWQLTNTYPQLLSFAQEPSLAMGVDADRIVFRFGAAGTGVNPTCRIARFEVGKNTVRLSVAVCEVRAGPTSGYDHLRRGERWLTEGEQRQLRDALARWDIERPPATAGIGAIDVNPELFEYRDPRHHVAIARFWDVDSKELFSDLHTFCYQVIAGTSLQPVEPGNRRPAPRQ